MTSIEILAIILAIIVLVKLFIITINPKLWMKVAEVVLSNYIPTTVIYFILTIIIGYYIFTSLNIVQVAAVILFASILIGLSLLPFSNTILKIRSEMLGTRSDMFRKGWLAIFIWGGIAVWVLYTILT